MHEQSKDHITLINRPRYYAKSPSVCFGQYQVDTRREHGFDNLDFGFDERGVIFGGKCLAGVGLPQYAIARITTGQFDGAGRIWGVEFAPDARE